MMNVVIGADPWGEALKDEVKSHLEAKGHSVVDVGTTGKNNEVAYYDVSTRAAQKIQAGDAERGILFCGTGMGVAIVANKFSGIHASVIESEFAARMCRAVNNANVMVTAIFPVRLAAPGIRPSRLLNQMKKNTLNR